MRKWLDWSLKIGFAAGVIAALGKRKRDKLRHTHQKEANERQAKIASKKAALQDKKAETEEHQTKEETYWSVQNSVSRTQRNLSYFTTVFALVAAIASVLSYENNVNALINSNKAADVQQNITMQALASARDQATINRAHIWIRIAPGTPIYGKTHGSSQPSVRVTFTLTNYGENPAILIGFQAKSIIDEHSEQTSKCSIIIEDFNPFFDEKACGQSQYTNPSDHNVIVEGISNYRILNDFITENPKPWSVSSIVEKGMTVLLTKEFEFDAFPASTGMPFLLTWVYITYRDIYGIDRKTSIYVKVPGGAPSDYHPEYNCWDDGCPKWLPAVIPSYR